MKISNTEWHEDLSLRKPRNVIFLPTDSPGKSARWLVAERVA